MISSCCSLLKWWLQNKKNSFDIIKKIKSLYKSKLIACNNNWRKYLFFCIVYNYFYISLCCTEKRKNYYKFIMIIPVNLRDEKRFIEIKVVFFTLETSKNSVYGKQFYVISTETESDFNLLTFSFYLSLLFFFLYSILFYFIFFTLFFFSLHIHILIFFVLNAFFLLFLWCIFT